MTESGEPLELGAGKLFRATSELESGDALGRDQPLYKVTGQSNGDDLFLILDGEKRFAALAEIKDTDWNELAQGNRLRSAIGGHARQLWSYLDGVAELERNDVIERVDLSSLERYAAVIYPHAPSPDVRLEVEDGFGEYGISVIWLDEPPPEEPEAFAQWTALYQEAQRSS